VGWYNLLLIIFGTFLLLMLSGFPIAFSFMAVMMSACIIIMGPISGMSFFLNSVFSALATFTLTPIPMFILMGAILLHSGLAVRSLDVISKFLGVIPGRLSILATISGALLGLLSGSPLAATSLLGSLLVPEMRKRGYSKTMSLGPILGSGGLAMIIPPSNLTVIFATTANISVGKLLVGGLIPGILMAILYLLQIIIRVIYNPSLAPKYEVSSSLLDEKLRSLFINVFPLGVIIFLVTGLILLGIATPTEAAAIGAVGSFLLAVFYRCLKWKVFVRAVLEMVKITVMVFMIVAGSVTYSQLLAYTGISRKVVNMVLELSLSPYALLLAMVLVVLILGTLMDQIAIIMITVPLFMPIISAFGFDPVWFGVLMLISLQIGLTTPPFGMLLFVMKGIVPEVTMGDLYRSSYPFILCNIISMILIGFIPSLALWLPNLL